MFNAMRCLQFALCGLWSWTAFAALDVSLERKADSCAASVKQSPASALAQLRMTRGPEAERLRSSGASNDTADETLVPGSADELLVQELFQADQGTERASAAAFITAARATMETASGTNAESLITAAKTTVDSAKATIDSAAGAGATVSAASTLANTANMLLGSAILPLHAAYIWGSLGVSAVLHSVWSMKKVKDAEWDASGNSDPIVLKHNYYRCLHGAPPLKFSGGLAKNAQAWADTGEAAKLEHSSVNSRMDIAGFRYVGENLAQVEDPVEAVDLWYSEISNTNSSSGGVEEFSAETGHYTQVVWKETVVIGCGQNQHLVVCQYGTGGNVAGRYDFNVLQQSKNDEDCKHWIEGIDQY